MIRKHHRYCLPALPVILFYFGGLAAGAETGLIDAGLTYQTMEGFGASIAWYDNWVTAHPNKYDLYDYLFDDLGLDILRIRNSYRYQSGNFAPDIREIVEEAEAVRGEPIPILMSSWSPPAALKSNGSTENGGTLFMEDGAFVYEDFADYWIRALEEYANIGIIPAYISIQNEPGFKADWESCVFKETETSAYAGYPQALEAVHGALQNLTDPPKLLGPEVLGIGYNLFQNYTSRLNRDLLYGYAHHLYHGGNHKTPDSFIGDMTKVASVYSDKPIFQTEFGGSERGDWFQTAWIIHNALVHEGVSAYLYWDLIWDGHGLIALENPWASNNWTTESGYTLTKLYYAFRQYSKYISPGWKRIAAISSAEALRISAFANPEAGRLCVVIINTGDTDQEMAFNFNGFNPDDGDIVRTSETEDGEYTGSFTDNPVALPRRSITTLDLYGSSATIYSSETRPSGFTVVRNYPNPFNPGTTISYQITKRTPVRLNICDTRGRVITTLVDEIRDTGDYVSVWNGTGEDNCPAASGIYVAELRAGRRIQTCKMILMR